MTIAHTDFVYTEGEYFDRRKENDQMVESTDLQDHDKEHRWPKKGDRLLLDSEDLDRCVEFSQEKKIRYIQLMNGYMSAGAALIDACRKNPHQRNFLIYSILFNYRHGIELSMKWIIAMYGHFSDIGNDNHNHHNLWKLWKVSKKIITDVGLEDGAVEVVEQVIKDFHDLDKSALALRYSQKRDGAIMSLPDGMIDLDNLYDVMKAVGNFFGGADAQLDEYLGYL